MADSRQIERAVRTVRDQKSFIQDLLIDALGWEIDERADDIEQISFEWSAAELRAEGLETEIADGVIRQIRPARQSPWGIFILEFRRPEVFTTGRGMTGTLRKVLRGLVPSKRKKSHLASFRCENLLFICNHDYKHFRFAHFKSPTSDIATPPLAAFGWGPTDPIRTLCEFNLGALEWPVGSTDSASWIADWSQAFDVEKVTKQFYKDYAAVFDKVEKQIGRHVEAASRRLNPDELRMFTQTLFNRLMFLRFIERKGWLTFDGSHDYLRALFAAGGVGKKSFFRGRLCPLFFEGLAVEGHEQSDAYGSVPYLNGGLFERSELDKKVTDLPDEVFADVLSDERAGGLFYRYNFTVEESTPLDIEVAVDPEMLGKVFEELVTGRHESGAYYTPRPVVSFMCREMLKSYLADKTKASSEAVAALVDRQDVSKLKEIHAREILAALDDVKAVDPACGSGAYLLGLLQEMILIYRQLYNPNLVRDERSHYDLKLQIISQTLYGVDIDPFATNIAMLRLWLSLAVEADTPVPLPNLDFKIETGDSLLAPDPQAMPDLFRAQLQASADVLVNVKRQYFSAHGEEKASYRQTILAEERRLREALHEEIGQDVVDWRIQFAEVFSRGRRGFDIVMANPPYVRKENIDKDTKTLLRRRYPNIPGQSDLFCYFYIRALELLRATGMQVFVCSNSWLDATYGGALQKYLLENAHVQAIYDSAMERQFATADVNTIISIIRKGRASKAALTQFVSLRAPFVDAIMDSTKRREVSVQRETLWQSGCANGTCNGRADYVGNKWGGLYLRAPDIYHSIHERNMGRLKRLSTVVQVHGYVHDNNTGAAYPNAPFLKSIKNTSMIRVERTSPGVIQFGVKREGNSRLVAPILFPRTFGSRHVVVWNPDGVFGKEFYKVIPDNPDDVITIVAQLNSTFGLLRRELLGLVNLGEGAIKFSGEDVGLFEVIDGVTSAQLRNAFLRIASRPILEPAQELEQPDRRELDRIIFASLGLTDVEQLEATDAAIALVQARASKASRVTNRFTPHQQDLSDATI